MLFSSTNSRLSLTRVLAIPLAFSLLFTVHSWPENGVFDLSIELIGAVFLAIAALGRCWTALFVSGRKTHELVTIGPYSMVRNPLYMFSFIGALGIGLYSENILVFFSLLCLFVFYYPSVIDSEEKILLNIHGQKFVDYCKQVPRLVPNIRLFNCPGSYSIDTKRVFSAFRDGLVFLLVLPLLRMIEFIQTSGYLPVLAKLPPSWSDLTKFFY